MAAVEGAPAPAERSPAPAMALVADPAPLGLAGFGITTLILSVFNAEILSTAGTPVVFGMALAYGGLAQLLAGMWEFKNNNTFGATAFTSYGAFWISFWALTHWDAANIGGDAGNAIGLYLVAWGIFTGYMFIASLGVSGAVATVFFLLTVTFFLLGIGEWAAYTNVHKAGGYVGLATAGAALYTSFAIVTNSTFKRTVLPTWPLARPLGKGSFVR
jgi:succinate-acetate transporter protein